LSLIGTLQAEVATIAGLKSQLQALQSAPPKTVEKIVEKIVDRPVDRVVEKVVEKMVDNPMHLSRIRALETDLQTLRSAPPKVVEKIVEKIVDRPVDRVIEKVIEKDKLVDNPAHLTRIAALEEELRTRRTRRTRRTLPARPAAVARARKPRSRRKLTARKPRQARVRSAPVRRRSRAATGGTINQAAAKAAGFRVWRADDLKVVEGIGPKIEGLLHKAGIRTFEELAATNTSLIQEILDKAGSRYKLANPSTWPEQSGLAAGDRWADLRALQDSLTAGVKK
jgi:predicted flap endonuclease-1-like 5' DNA nuclease